MTEGVIGCLRQRIFCKSRVSTIKKYETNLFSRL